MERQPVHFGVQPLEFLLGAWRGEGTGQYPTIEDFSYAEEARFWHDGRPLIHYAQRTWSAQTGAPMHSEMGFLRIGPGGGLELMLAHVFGIVEVEEGTLTGQRIELAATTMAFTSTAKHVDRLERVIQVQGGVLTYEVQMAAVGQPLHAHLRAQLRLEG
jgi:hypothetical protein